LADDQEKTHFDRFFLLGINAMFPVVARQAARIIVDQG
jgi:hypothetical protein